MPATTQAPLRTCPHCGLQEHSTRERCTRCGRSVLVRPPRLSGRRRTLAIWGGAAAAVVVVAVCAVVLTSLGDDQSKRVRKADAKAAAAEIVRLQRIQSPHRGAAAQLRPAAGASRLTVLAARAALVSNVESAITRDAQARVKTGEVQGPIVRTECGPLLRAKDAVPDDRFIEKMVGRYDCVAVKRNIIGDAGQSVGRLGYAFVAALNFKTFSYVWCRNSPPPGEAGQALAFVRLDRACLAAKGKAVGNGYLDVPGS